MTIEAKFDDAMMSIYTRAKTEAGYNATTFLDILYRHRGLLTAKMLINAPKPSEGYTRLNLLKRLDLTVEAVIIDNPQWHCLFDNDELDRARRRLTAFKYVTNIQHRPTRKSKVDTRQYAV